MQVRVLPFGVLKDCFGSSVSAVELPEHATVADLLEVLAGISPSTMKPARRFQGIAVSVNAEYATSTHVLADGDEVGLLPPVSGGAAGRETFSYYAAVSPSTVTALTRQPIDTERLVADARAGEDGAVVVFDGIVRNNSRGRQTLYLDYEAYEEMARKQIRELAQRARARFSVRHVTVIHRLGRLEVGETSVLIIVASAHRAAAFEACRWLIDTLKQTVPIWKKETFVDGAVWAAGEPFPADLAMIQPEASHEA